MKTTPKVFRMYFSSWDVIGDYTTTSNRPLFDVSTAAQSFTLFDPDKPIFFMIENIKISNQTTSKLYSFVWENCPPCVYQHTWSSSLGRIPGVLMALPNVRTDAFLPPTQYGYQLPSPNNLQPSLWQFGFYDNSGTLLTAAEVGGFLFSILFYQES